MVHHKKRYNCKGLVDNKVKVKEEKHDNIIMKEKMKKNEAEGDKKAEENQNSSKRKMAKNKEEKEKKMRVVDQNDDEEEREDQGKRKENGKKENLHKEKKKESEKEEQGQREIEKEKEEEQKEINEEKGRTANGKEEEYSKDQNDKKNCPHFFRALIPNSFMEHVTIPVGFQKYLEDCKEMVSLRGPSGNKWPVELANISGELCFARGWKEFLSDHHVGYGYLLVFRYDGKSQFSVTVFLPSSCEAPYASLALPQHKDIDVAREEDKGLTSTNADGTTPQEEDTHNGTSADGATQNESSEEEDSLEDEGAEEVEDTFSETSGNEEDCERRMCSDNALEPTQEQQDDRRKTDDGFLIGKRARFRKVDDIMAEVDRSKKFRAAKGKNIEAPFGDPASGGAASSDSLAESKHRPPMMSKAEEIHHASNSTFKSATSSENSTEVASHPSKDSKVEGKISAAPLMVYTMGAASPSKRVPLKTASEKTTSSDNLAVHTGVFALESVCTDLTTWHKSFGKRLSKQNQFPMFNKSNGENQPGRVLIKVMRRPGLKSQRRPVTQREKEWTMERAERFKSHRPFTVKAMKHNDVYASYFMIIPDMFVKTFLPEESRNMTLWDPQATPWKVWYEYTGGESPRAAFSSGWGVLAMHNNLEKWDVCVFELLDQEYNIKMHVYKVVLEITPCVIAPKRRTCE